MDNYLTVKDVMNTLHLSKNVAYSLIRQKDFPKIQIGKKYLIPENKFDEYLKHYLYHTIDI